MKRIAIVCLGLALLAAQGHWPCAQAQQAARADIKEAPASANQIPGQGVPAAPGFPGQPPGFPGGGSNFRELVPVLIDAMKDSEADVRRDGTAGQGEAQGVEVGEVEGHLW